MQALSFTAGAPAVHPQMAGQGKGQPATGAVSAFAALLAAAGAQTQEAFGAVLPGAVPAQPVAGAVAGVRFASSPAMKDDPSLESPEAGGAAAEQAAEQIVATDDAVGILAPAVQQEIPLQAETPTGLSPTAPLSMPLPAGEGAVPAVASTAGMEVSVIAVARPAKVSVTLATKPAAVPVAAQGMEPSTARSAPVAAGAGRGPVPANTGLPVAAADAAVVQDAPGSSKSQPMVPASALEAARAAPADGGPAVMVEETVARRSAEAVRAQVADGFVKAKVAAGGRVTVQLNPQELGRVEVTLLKGEGQHSARIVVDRAETLDVVRSEIRHLERALAEAGMDVRSGSVSVALRGSSADGALPGQGEGGNGREVPAAFRGQEDAAKPEAGPRRLADGHGSKLNISV